MIVWPGLEDYEVGAVYVVDVPTYVKVSKRQVKALNLNVYRNLHHHHLNEQKKNFHAEVKTKLGNLPHMQQVAIHYEVFAARNNRVDTMNIGSIVDKYFSDTMVEAKRLLDDNFNHIIGTSFSYGGVERLGGFCRITIYELKRKDEPMRHFLDDQEIETAITEFVEKSFPNLEVRDLIFTFDGSLEVEVVTGPPVPDEEQPEAESPPKKKGRGGRPRGSKNKPKEVEPDADEDSKADTSGSDTGGGEQPTEDAEEAAEPEATQKTDNPFAEGGNESSESADETTTEDSGTPETAEDQAEEAPVKKKPSIFDVE